MWTGALALADLILSLESHIQGHTILELGSGTGLLACVLAETAKVVIATDADTQVLQLCQVSFVAINKDISMIKYINTHIFYYKYICSTYLLAL